MKPSHLARVPVYSGIFLLAASCGLGTPSRTPTPAALTPAAPSVAAVIPAPPTDSAIPLATPSTQPDPGGPPAGFLEFAGTSVEGFAGSFCWDGTCGDVLSVPPKDGLPFVEAPGDTLEFSVADGAFIGWSASYGPDASNFQQLATGGSLDDPDANPSSDPSPLSFARFTAPPVGDWIIHVSVRFADGDAIYWWHVSVI
ncbi:MAG: hypothetical protein ABIP53_11845 [Candidatus Limnocylindrales bacterium]